MLSLTIFAAAASAATQTAPASEPATAPGRRLARSELAELKTTGRRKPDQ
jgi:hypothetical protein